MPGTCGNVIVERALALREQQPTWPASQVLDAALDRYINTHPDFETDGAGGVADWLDPPSAFARLVRDALAPDLAIEDFDAESEAWHSVVEAFGDRYQLWR